MWNDEDNNPYGSFDRRDSNSSDAPNEYAQNRRTCPAEFAIKLIEALF